MKWFVILIIFLKSATVFAQSNKLISIKNFDYNYLNQQIHKKINSIRSNSNIGELDKNEVAKNASQIHAKYLSKQTKISHYQKNTINKTVTDRIDNYTDKFIYAAGENIAQSYIFKPSFYINNKGHRVVSSDSTYEDLAETIVEIWVNSSPHYKNIIKPEYELSGISSIILPDQLRVIVVQVFIKLKQY